MAGYQPRTEYEEQKKQPYTPAGPLQVPPTLRPLFDVPERGAVSPGVYKRQTLPTAGQPLPAQQPPVPAPAPRPSLQRAQSAPPLGQMPKNTPAVAQVFPLTNESAAKLTGTQPARPLPPLATAPVTQAPTTPAFVPAPGLPNVHRVGHTVSFPQNGNLQSISSEDNPAGIARVQQGLVNGSGGYNAAAEADTLQKERLHREGMARLQAGGSYDAPPPLATQQPQYDPDQLAQAQFDRARSAADDLITKATSFNSRTGLLLNSADRDALRKAAIELYGQSAGASNAGVNAGAGIVQEGIRGTSGLQQENIRQGGETERAGITAASNLTVAQQKAMADRINEQAKFGHDLALEDVKGRNAIATERAKPQQNYGAIATNSLDPNAPSFAVYDKTTGQVLPALGAGQQQAQSGQAAGGMMTLEQYMQRARANPATSGYGDDAIKQAYERYLSGK